MTTKNLKSSLRMDLLNSRETLKDRDLLSINIQDQVLEFIRTRKDLKLSTENILLYASFGSEPKTDKLIEYELKENGYAILPFCDGDKIIATKITDISDLNPGKFKIRELDTSRISLTSRAIDPSSLDIILVPGLGFDLTGNRLGYGQGYYDRFLPLCTSAIKIGLCFEKLIIPNLPIEETDQKVDFIISESKTYKTKK